MKSFLLLVGLAAAMQTRGSGDIDTKAIVQETRDKQQAQLDAVTAKEKEANDIFNKNQQDQKFLAQELTEQIEREEGAQTEAAGKAAAANAEIEKMTARIAKLKEEAAAALKEFSSNDRRLGAKVAENAGVVEMVGRAISVLKRAGVSFAQVKGTVEHLTVAIGAIVDAGSVMYKSNSELQALVQTQTDAADDLDFPQAKESNYESKSGGIVAQLETMKGEAEDAVASAQKEQMQAKMAHQKLMMNNQFAQKDAGDRLSRAEGALKGAESDEAGAKSALSEASTTLGNTKKAMSDAAVDRRGAANDAKAEISTLQTNVNGCDAFLASQKGNNFLQLSSASSDIAEAVARQLSDAAREFHSVGLAQLAVRARQADGGFDKVKGLINRMIEELQNKQDEEAEKEGFCRKEQGANDAKRKKINGGIATLRARADKAQADADTENSRAARKQEAIANGDGNIASLLEKRGADKKTFDSFDADSNAKVAKFQKVLDFFDNFQGAGNFDSIKKVVESLKTDVEAARQKAREEEAADIRELKDAQQDWAVEGARLKAEVKGHKDGSDSQMANKAENEGDLKSLNTELDAALEEKSTLAKQCNQPPPPTFEERQAKRKREIEALHDALDRLS